MVSFIRPSAWDAFSAFWRVMADICSMEEELSSRVAACWLAPWASSWEAPANSPEAPATWSEPSVSPLMMRYRARMMLLAIRKTITPTRMMETMAMIRLMRPKRREPSLSSAVFAPATTVQPRSLRLDMVTSFFNTGIGIGHETVAQFYDVLSPGELTDVGFKDVFLVLVGDDQAVFLEDVGVAGFTYDDVFYVLFAKGGDVHHPEKHASYPGAVLDRRGDHENGVLGRHALDQYGGYGHLSGHGFLEITAVSNIDFTQEFHVGCGQEIARGVCQA